MRQVFVSLTVCVGVALAGQELELEQDLKPVGPPELPDVETMLSKAADTAKVFATQAATMQEQALQQSQASKDALEKQKASYEMKLAAQQEKQDKIRIENQAISADMKSLKTGNDALTKQARMLKRSNGILREAIRVMGPKMRTATLFLSDSLRLTDISEDKELGVLTPEAPAPTLENFLKVLDAGKVAEKFFRKPKTSLLNIGAESSAVKRKAGKPEGTPIEIVESLSKKLDQLETASTEGETNLKAHFLALYEIGDKVTVELQNEQQALQAERETHIKLQDDLHAAKKHLMETQETLKHQLKALQTFVMNADGIVAATFKDADAALTTAGTVDKKSSEASKVAKPVASASDAQK